MNPELVESWVAGHVLGPEYAALAAVVLACAIKAVGTVTTSYYSVRAAWRAFRAARARLAARALLKRQLLIEDLLDAQEERRKAVCATFGPALPHAWEVQGRGEDLAGK